MARKTLLNEQEIRSFLKLANIKSVGDAKIEEMGGGKYYNRDSKDDDDQDTVAEEVDDLEEMGMGAAYERDDDEGMMDAGAPDDDAALDAVEDELGDDLDDDMSDMGGGTDEMTLSDEEADAIIMLADKLKAARDDGGAEMGDMDAVDEPAVPGLEDEEEPEEPIEMSEEDENAPEGGDSMLEGADEDDIVAEVARRVADRLKASQQKEQMVDQLAERILNRLTNK